MDELTRRELLKLGGAGALGLGASGLGLDLVQAAGPAVRVLLNGARAATGAYAFPAEVDTVALDNGLIRFTFGRDDADGGIVTGWPDTSVTATSVVVDGT